MNCILVCHFYPISTQDYISRIFRNDRYEYIDCSIFRSKHLKIHSDNNRNAHIMNFPIRPFSQNYFLYTKPPVIDRKILPFYSSFSRIQIVNLEYFVIKPILQLLRLSLIFFFFLYLEVCIFIFKIFFTS